MPYRFRGRGQITAPTSRSGKGYTYAGRRVLLKGNNFELTWNGPQVALEILSALTDAFANLSDQALSYMQSVVPVDTGRLRDSCFVQLVVQGSRLQIVIGADTPYAVYVELGTSVSPAQPYIRPTFDFVIQNLAGIIRNEVSRRAR
jgi:HK97 gp10 family phage protein